VVAQNPLAAVDLKWQLAQHLTSEEDFSVNCDGQCIDIDSIRLAFVGAVVPESIASQYPAYSAAGNLFQLRLLVALQQNGLTPSAIYSGRPVPSFPAIRQLWFPADQAELGDGLSVYLLPFVNLGALKIITLGLAAFFSLLRWGWRERHAPHRVILTYNVSYPHGTVTLLAARLIWARAFALVADLPVPGDGVVRAAPLRRLDCFLQTKSLPLFDGIVVLTRNMANDFAPRVPFIHMEGAVPKELLQSLTDLSQTDQSTGPYCTLMYAGKLDELRGIPLLLQAFSLLSGDQYRLWITGQGPLREQVEQAAKEDPRITYWGFLPYAEILSLYRKATILINPRCTKSLATRYQFPSKVVEYLATGKPVITTCTADVEEEYRGLVLALRDETPEALARLIDQVARMGSADRNAIGVAARQYILERKTWEHQGKRIAEFIRRQVQADW